MKISKHRKAQKHCIVESPRCSKGAASVLVVMLSHSTIWWVSILLSVESAISEKKTPTSSIQKNSENSVGDSAIAGERKGDHRRPSSLKSTRSTKPGLYIGRKSSRRIGRQLLPSLSSHVIQKGLLLKLNAFQLSKINERCSAHSGPYAPCGFDKESGIQCRKWFAFGHGPMFWRMTSDLSSTLKRPLWCCCA